MPVRVVADAAGRIVSISPAEPPRDSDHGPVEVDVVAGPGHVVHVLDLPEALAARPLAELHDRYALDLQRGRLVEADGRRPAPGLGARLAAWLRTLAARLDRA